MRTSLSLFLAAGALALAACADAPTTAAAGIDQAADVFAATQDDAGLLGRARAATAKYLDAEAALADGYVSTYDCVATPSGAMGVHYVKPPLFMDAGYDVEQPEALVYEPQADGSFRLVAIEYIVMKAPWDATNPGTVPQLLGQPFLLGGGPMGAMYALHVWAWRQNPSGLFAPFNPRASCGAAVNTVGHQH